MRKLALVVVAITVLGAWLAPPASAHPPPPPKDKVEGKGINNPPITNHRARFDIHAESLADGSSPTGTVKFKTMKTGAETNGKVTCLKVSGNRATIGVKVNKSTTTVLPKPNALIVYLEDNGPVVHGLPVDKIRSEEVASAPTVCPTPVDPDRPALVQGNIKIVDM